MKAGAAKGLQVSRESTTAHKMASEAIKKFQKFENIHEVADTMGVEVDSIAQLPIAAFANRLIFTMFESIFTIGWEAKCADAQVDLKSFIKNPEERLSKAQKHIRILKTVSKYMGCAIEDGVKSDEAKEWFRNWQAGQGTDEIDAVALTEIFNAGDFRTNKVLKSMTEVLREK